MAPPPGHKHSRIIDGQRYVWLIERLIVLSRELERFELPIDSLQELDQDCWFGETTATTIRRVADHCRRILEADLQYPVILNADGRLMDGGHRIAKALLAGRRTVQAVRFATMPEPDWTEAA